MSDDDQTTGFPRPGTDRNGLVRREETESSASPASLNINHDIARLLAEEAACALATRRRSITSIDTGSSPSLLFEMSGSEDQRSEPEEETSRSTPGATRTPLPFQMPLAKDRMESLPLADSSSVVATDAGLTDIMARLRRWRDIGLVKTRLLSATRKSDEHVLPEPSLNQPVVLCVVPVLAEGMNAAPDLDDLPSREPFVVKIQIDPVTRKRGRKVTAIHKAPHTEADILKNLSHENIIRFIKSDSRKVPDFPLTAEHDEMEVNQSVLITEYAGVDLRQYLTNRPHPDILVCLLCLAVQLMRGLEYLQESEIVHCDIKPENLLAGGHVVRNVCHCLKIADFNLAYNAANGFRSREGEIGGSLHFMAPELKRLAGTDPVQPQTYASDIYSAGITLAVMLLEHHVVSSFYRIEQGKSVTLDLEDEYRQNPLATSFVCLVQMLLNKAPASRPTARQAGIDLLQLFDQYSKKGQGCQD